MSGQKNRLQRQSPGVFSPKVYRGVQDKSNNVELQNKDDLAKRGVSNSEYFAYDAPGEGVKTTQQIPLDFSKFENHTFFNSAQANVNVAYDNIINNYPFDGSRKELEAYLGSLTGFEKYVLGEFPKNLGYLVFSGATARPTGGLLESDGTYIEVKDFAGASFPAISKDQTGDSIISFRGTSFSAEGHVLLAEESNGNEVIYQKLSGSNKGFTLALSESSSTNSAELIYGISSGSVSLVTSASIEKGVFNHVCAVYDRDTEDGQLKLFINQKLESSSPKKAYFGEIDFNFSPMFIATGSTHASLLDDSLSFVPNRTFSGSIDEVRIFHKARTIGELRESAHRGIYASPELKLYLKFNEPSGSFGNNAVVLDSSGNSLHSLVTNYSLYNRETGSLPVALSSESRENNPVLFPAFDKVVSLNQDLLLTASRYDEDNPNLITKLIPPHYLDEGRDYFGFKDNQGEIVDQYSGSINPGTGRLGSSQIVTAMLFTWAKQFDEIKTITDQFSQLTNPTYENTSGISDAFLPFLAQRYGISLPPILTDASAKQFYHGEDVQDTYTDIAEALQNIRSKLLKRMLVNIQDVISSKGTIHSVKSLFRSIGLDSDILIRIKEYGGPKKFSLTENRKKRAMIQPRLTFSGALTAVPTPDVNFLGFDARVPYFMTTYLSSSRIEVGYPEQQGTFVKTVAGTGIHGISNSSSDGLQTSGSWSAEIMTRYPGLITGSYAMSQSLMRLHVTGTASPSTNQGVVANLLAMSGTSSKVKLYVRAASANYTATYKPALTLALTGVNVMDGDDWSISFGRYRHDDPESKSISAVSSSYFLRCAKQKNGNITHLYQTSAFYLEDPRHKSVASGSASYDVFQNISKFNESGSFVVIGSQSIDNSANVFLNGLTVDGAGSKIAHESRTTKFQGDVSYIRFWSKGLSFDDWKEHARNPQSTGVENPLVNFNFEKTESGSFERMRLDLNMDQKVTSSDGSGRIDIVDLSQGAVSASVGKGFEPNKDLKRYEKVFFSSISPFFDEAESDSKVRVRSFVSASNRDEFNALPVPLFQIPIDDMPEDDPRFSIDFSVANALNEDIINIFSTLDAIDNAIGNPDLAYSSNYPELENLRDIYFNKLTDKVNFKNFLDYFRWFDKSVGQVVEDLLPKKTKFLGINFVIEPHSLERSKLQYQDYDTYLGPDFRTNLKGIILLQQIVGRLKRF